MKLLTYAYIHSYRTMSKLVMFVLYFTVLIIKIECAVIVSNQERKLITSADNTGQIQGEIIVLSPPLTVKGPPKGFPLVRYRRDAVVHIDNNNNYTIVKQTPVTVENNDKTLSTLEKKGKKYKSKGNLMKTLMPYMLVPAMMGLGYAPLVISNLKMFIMSAFMVNMMALNVAIFITLRNMVFGPRFGEHIRYHNFGYNHEKHKHPKHTFKHS